MRNTFKHILGAVAVALSFSTIANAGLIQQTYTDQFTTPQNQVDRPLVDLFSFTHDINSYGFNSELETVTSVNMSLSLVDDNDPDVWTSTQMCFGPFCINMPVPPQLEGISVFIDGVLMAVEEIDYQPIAILNINTASLQNDGLLEVSLMSTGDYYFYGSTLTVETEQVPAPGVLVLIAVGLLGVSATRRLRKASN